MADTKSTSPAGGERDDFCDIRVWSGDCEHTISLYSGDKYLCDKCGTMSELEQEVHPAPLSYVSGDYHSMS